MHATSVIRSRRWLSCAALAAALAAAASCSELLGLPSDPMLVREAPSEPDASSSELPSASPADTSLLPGAAQQRPPKRHR